MSYDDEDYLRTRSFRMVLKPNEAKRLREQAEELGLSQANFVRHACPKIFDEVDVTAGRKEGISPRRRDRG